MTEQIRINWYRCKVDKAPMSDLMRKSEFFLKLFGFLAWWDPVAYRISHVKHHQVTVHSDHDGEVVLPLGLDWHGVKFILSVVFFIPPFLLSLFRQYVPFYNLPRLREAIVDDMPPAPHGLWATWKEIIPILKRQRRDPHYSFRPTLPRGDGENVGDGILQVEAALS